jgi:hypothetical protein
VRGAEGIVVTGLLGLTGALTGAAVGFVAGVAWAVAGLPEASPVVAVALAAAALVLDALGWPRPLAVRRQVPQLYGRWFGARTVAVLYGARLGVGPLTILATWTWWAALVVGASLGPWLSALVGTAFALSRTATMLVAVAGTDTGTAMSTRIAAVRRARPVVAWVSAVAVVAVALAACSDDDPSPAAGGTTTTTTTEEPSELELEPETSTTTTPEDTAVTELLLDETLPGFVPGDVAVLDLEAAAQQEQDVEAERALLSTRHFERGASRAWASGDDVAYVAAYRFAGAEDATAYLADGQETIEARGATPFAVPEVPGALGFTTIEESADGVFTTYAVAFTRGPLWFLVLVGSPGSERTAEEARALAIAQSGRAVALGS